MKRPTVASLKKVTPENLASLGVERLAEIVMAAAQTRPELKRRLRMELAAEQGAEHLAAEVDRRLGSLETSKSKVSWRQRPTFVRDLDVLRVLIAERLAGLDGPGALARMWLFMEIARRVGGRVRDKDGELAAVFARAAADIGRMLGAGEPGASAAALVDALVAAPAAWAQWLPGVLAAAPEGTADVALRLISERSNPAPGWVILVRQLADAAGDVDAWLATFPGEALRAQVNAAQAGRRLLAAGRVENAGRVLEAAAPAKARKGWLGGKAPDPDDDWEGAWIDYLEASGQGDAAQAARWASFERTLSVERAKAFTRRLADFDDVEAEQRAFAHAAGHEDFARGLAFLMDWPAYPDAGRMILARADEAVVGAEAAELWAGRLRARNPAAAELLLRKAAAAAFKRREFKVSERLTQEADTY
jgi:uncharacterized protein DUF6880